MKTIASKLTFRLIALCALLAVGFAQPAKAQFVVHEATGKVSVIRNGNTSSVKAGTECERNDKFKIEEGASLSLLNKITNKVYSVSGPGEMTISQIITQAMDRAKSHASNVLGAMNFGKSSQPATVYEQNGMVRRSQAVLDPEAYTVSIEPEALAVAILRSILSDSINTPNGSLEVTGQTDLLGFKAKSTSDSPIYFNIIKLRLSDEGIESADISELGQPINAYVLQPGQELSREQPTDGIPGERHFLVATHFGYDIDSLLDAMEELIDMGAVPEVSNPELTIYVYSLNKN